MNFSKVLSVLLNFFQENDIRFAIIGAFGLGAYGLSRMTMDLDFVVDKASQSLVVSFLESLGYETRYVSTGYSNHLHAKQEMGRLDFVYIDGETADRIFSSVHNRVFAQDLALPVPRPEHIAAMKIFAMKNDPSREYQEMADLQFILSLPGIDKKEIKGYFESYGLEEKYEELARKTENARS